MKDKDLALKVAGLMFLLVAIMHLMRILLKTQVYVGSHHVRLLMSLVAFVISLLLALWMFSASKK
jgi:hypothetical protein